MQVCCLFSLLSSTGFQSFSSFICVFRVLWESPRGFYLKRSWRSSVKNVCICKHEKKQECIYSNHSCGPRAPLIMPQPNLICLLTPDLTKMCDHNKQKQKPYGTISQSVGLEMNDQTVLHICFQWKSNIHEMWIRLNHNS